MITHHVDQGSLEWLMLRAGIPTASEMDALVTPKFALRKGEGVLSYVDKKVAERWQGGPLPTYQGFDMDQGKILEQEAIPWYELKYDAEVKRVGFITTDDGRVGCSPDGLLGEEGIEIKCPAAHTHTGYLRKGELPDEYAIQVHASMFVTGLPRWKFLSYRRQFPPLVLTIERDEKIQEVIAEAIANFHQLFDEGMALMTERNGGPPRPLTPLKPMPEKKPSPAPAPAVNIDEVIP